MSSATSSKKKKTSTASEEDEEKSNGTTSGQEDEASGSSKSSIGGKPTSSSSKKKKGSTESDSASTATAPQEAGPAETTKHSTTSASTPKPKTAAGTTKKNNSSAAGVTVATPAPSPASSTPEDAAKKKYAPSATIATADLQDFSKQPEGVQQLIQKALELSKLNLTYKFGSADPAEGGMDCSGAVHYLLKQQGFKDVPRDSAGQYVWARKNGEFFAVISKKAGGFEFSDLQPGDLMFWSGTYSADRDPPVTHSMIYLGMHRKRKQPVMWGSSDGRSYNGEQRYGVSVFDFRMPKTDTVGTGGTPVDFLGYARIPGLREKAAEAAEQ